MASVDQRWDERFSHDSYADDEARYAHEYDKGPGLVRRALRRFVRRHGWRAYALPVLVIVTVVAGMRIASPSHATAASASPGHPTAHPAVAPLVPTSTARSSRSDGVATGSNAVLKTDQPGSDAERTPLASDALPAGPAYTLHGTGTFRVLPGTGPVVGHGPLSTYTIDVENGVTGVDLTAFTTTIAATLADPRSWSGHGVSLQRVDSGSADFHISLTSSLTVRSLCGYQQKIETSCFAPDVSRVVLNVARWVRGAVAYIGDLAAYHQEMINHEVGHALGHQHSHVCLSNGLAPTMMQQTIGLRSASGTICAANPWPYPPGVTDAPGAEGPDTPQNSPLVPA